MTELLTAAQMRAIEQAAIASGEVTGLELMERAGEGVVEAIFEEWPELGEGERRAVVLCGPGNNGGDGFVVARLLKEQGWQVEVFLYGDPEKLPPDARVNYELWLKIGDVKQTSEFEVDLKKTRLFLDAAFGIGLSRALETDLIGFGERAFNSRGNTYFVAVDVPTGLCADRGSIIGEDMLIPYTELTVTFHRAKQGHTLAEGLRACGNLVVKDIGLGKWDHHKNVV